ncbi:hypothetical protein GOODEAATRI_019781, partial [Goodea atripinnis]
NHLIVLMLLVFEATVYRHQVHHYRQLQRSSPSIPTLFPSAKRDTLDQGLIPCLKYLLNYTFYKFGLEVDEEEEDHFLFLSTADFLLLMCASQQWKVFECEKKEEWMVQAGENTDELDPMEGQLFNPAPNFINCRSYLDMVKVLVFRYFFWFVLSMVFITGATRISVFGLGYLIASFFFLLFGTKLLVKPSRVRLMLWDCLIIYNVAVIISKNLLSVSRMHGSILFSNVLWVV